MARATVTMSLRISPPELADQIDIAARNAGMSRNEWILRVLERRIARETATKP